MKLINRMKQPTPPFFKKLRNIGVTVAAVSGTILAAPVALPAALVSLAGYLAVAGTVASAVSQAATGSDEAGQEQENHPAHSEW